MTTHPSLERCRRDSERGAILLQVATGCVILIAFTMFVVDYGMMWVARRQAQNAADAGALAGAVALALDGDDGTQADGPAKTSAYQYAIANQVLGVQPSVTDPTTGDATDVMFYNDNPAKFPAECATGGCIRVDVYRNQQRNNPVPAWFGALVGVNNSGVRATATAQAGIGDTTDCLKPWAVVDKWDQYWEGNMAVSPAPGPWTTAANFDKYLTRGPAAGTVDPSITTPDVYVAPNTTSTGTGFYPYSADGSFSPWYGLEITLKLGNTNGNNAGYDYSSGWFLALQLTDSKGGNDYGNNIKRCIGVNYTIGDQLPIQTEPGDKVGPTRQAVLLDDERDGGGPSLINQDPTAYWDPTMSGGRGGVNGSQYSVSPRIVAVPLLNPDELAYAVKNGRASVPIVNIMGFFVEDMPDNKSVRGRLVTLPGLKASGAPKINAQSAFLKVIQLIR